jgi:hypothetical protein
VGPGHRRRSTSLVALCVAGLTARAALGAPGEAEAEARKLREEAVYTDYLAMSFADAEAKLRRAIALCEAPESCSRALRARLACDLGVIAFVLQRTGDAQSQFVAALKEDATVTIDKDLSSVELERQFAIAKGGGSAAAAPSATDCPPQFPGCRSTSKSAACVTDDECPAGRACTDGACNASESAEARARAPFDRNWISVAFQADALLMPSATNACAGGTGYTCFGDDGSYYGDTPLAGADDQVNGGLTLATSRVLLGYDRAVWENLTLGVRLGYALGGGPQRPTSSGFLPAHVEARAAYWFGDNPLSRSGFRFFVLAAGGIAQVDASVPVDLYASMSAYQGQQSQGYRAWKKTGLAFAALGGGTMLAITPSTGFVVEAKAMEMFPTPATGFSLQLGYVVGL